MAALVVSIICIAMIVVGGMTLSQGILTSADTAATSVQEISVREGEMMRTDIDAVRAAYLSWSDLLRVTVKNTGQTKLASYDKWDVIANYFDSTDNYTSRWLPHTDATPVDNEWQNARIGLNGPTEFFEPGILNPEEEMVILAHLNPPPKNATNGNITVATPNGINSSISFSNLGYARLTPQSENITIAGVKYYELVEAAPADGAAMISRAEFTRIEGGGRKVLYNVNEPNRAAKHIYPLIGIREIPEAYWTVYYRCYTWGGGGFPRQDEDVCFNIDILVRAADGTLRATIDTEAAPAYVNAGDEGVWLTISVDYDFPGYTVVDENDYLEIDFYGQTTLGPDSDSGYMQLSMDDGTLPISEQTRIED
jgi:archaellum component FlaF (FlaF/FlaG flagellin family)